MYCHTSSSVQLEIGNTRTCSPFRMRPLNSDHSSGRWRLGSHWPKSSRNENTRFLARARSSSRLAPPNAASNPCPSIAFSSRVVRRRLRHARGPAFSDLAGLGAWGATDRGVPPVVERMVWQVVLEDVCPQVLFSPVRDRVELPQPALVLLDLG